MTVFIHSVVQMNRVLIAVTALLALSALLPVSDGAKKLLLLSTSCVPTKCQVCEKLALRLHQLVKEKHVELSLKKISEYEIIEIAENVCNLKKEEADWMLKINFVEKGDKLQLIEQEEGMCNSEYKTIEAACQKDLTDACSKNSPPVSKDWVPDKPFVAKPSKDTEMDKIMRSMQGMPGALVIMVYSREDIEKYKKMLDEARHEIDVLVSRIMII